MKRAHPHPRYFGQHDSLVGAGQDVPVKFVHKAPHARAHFFGGLDGKCERDDACGRNAFEYKKDNSENKRGGFSGAGAGQNQQRSADFVVVKNCFELFGIQTRSDSEYAGKQA